MANRTRSGARNLVASGARIGHNGAPYLLAVTVCRSLRMVLCAALFCGVVQAQQSGSASVLPDAPSATVPAQSENKPDVIGAVPVVNLLAGRSRVFPNLAVNTTPLSKREKFELSPTTASRDMRFLAPASRPESARPATPMPVSAREPTATSSVSVRRWHSELRIICSALL